MEECSKKKSPSEFCKRFSHNYDCMIIPTTLEVNNIHACYLSAYYAYIENLSCKNLSVDNVYLYGDDRNIEIHNGVVTLSSEDYYIEDAVQKLVDALCGNEGPSAIHIPITGDDGTPHHDKVIDEPFGSKNPCKCNPCECNPCECGK